MLGRMSREAVQEATLEVVLEVALEAALELVLEMVLEAMLEAASTMLEEVAPKVVLIQSKVEELY